MNTQASGNKSMETHTETVTLSAELRASVEEAKKTLGSQPQSLQEQLTGYFSNSPK